jgi:alkyldihydroxyacetonephosphate synthase
MRRWNGWGDDEVVYHLPASASRFLEEQVGKATLPKDASLEAVLSQIPKSRLRQRALLSTDTLPRLLHARGQSFPDWVALRSGMIDAFPDGVAFPTREEDIAELLQYAHKKGIRVIPYGGGTSVTGHIDPIKCRDPILSVDMRRLNRLVDLEVHNLAATFGAGVTGPDLEAQLRAHGFTLGHFPQSFEYSTLGGWVATRSSGQLSLRYGRIEKLFAGGRLESPVGRLDLPPFPASAAGPDVREMVLGSEGRMGILTQAQVRISPLPEREDFHTVFFPDFQHGVEAVRHILIAGLIPCMLRLSTAVETTTTLALAGHENLIGALERLLAIRGLGEGKCMLLIGFSGKASLVRMYRSEAFAITNKWDGIHVGKVFGEQWHKNRFRTPYLRNTLWERGYGVDTLETATDWANTPKMVEEIETSIREAMAEFGEPVHIFTHLSHVYLHGSSVYTTLLFRLAGDPEETLTRWRRMKSAASQAIIRRGGTISHQHGVGLDHMPYLEAEKGALGIKAITSIFNQLDPKGIMNPGKLVA